MESIIRAASVSLVARRIGRVAGASAPAPVGAVQSTLVKAPIADDAPAPPAELAADSAEPISVVAPAAVTSAIEPAAMPSAPACACAGELARAEREHEQALARRDAEIDTLRKSAQQAAIELTDAFTDAEERGFAAGEKKGLARAAEKVQAQIDRVTALAEQVAEAANRRHAAAEDAMVDIVFTVICRILGEQCASRVGIQEMVAQTAALVRERDQLVVRLHPDDAALFKDAADDAMRISADASVLLGGCVIDSPAGSLDARLETQLEALAAALKEVRASRTSTGDAE